MEVGNYSGVSWVLICDNMSEKSVKINVIRFKLIRCNSGWGMVMKICWDGLFIIILFELLVMLWNIGCVSLFCDYVSINV